MEREAGGGDAKGMLWRAGACAGVGVRDHACAHSHSRTRGHIGRAFHAERIHILCEHASHQKPSAPAGIPPPAARNPDASAGAHAGTHAGNANFSRAYARP